MDTRELVVRAPFAGRVLELREVPDDVFSAAVLGPGLAIWPHRVKVPVIAPVGGDITAWHAHACAISPGDDAPAILVHLGLDTVALQGRGFSWHVKKAARVAQGQLMCAWDLSQIGNYLPVTPVVAMGEVDITRLAGDEIEAGEALFSVATS